MKNTFREFLLKRTPTHPVGIPSLCSSNPWVLDAGMKWAKENGVPLLLESTANQINQFGGYTGLTPQMMAELIKGRAEAANFPLSELFLGGDHLGPMVWKNEPAESAMAKADTLVYDFVLAGFTKIHLDASMPLADDDITNGMSPVLVAERAARLAVQGEKAYGERLKKDPGAMPPVYVIGSEVPIAGGIQDNEDALAVTSPESFRETVNLFREAFYAEGLLEAWDRVVAVVVQPGVEYGNETVIDYDPQAAEALVKTLNEFPGLVFEGHSTDYQQPAALSAMIRDGIAILKIGPALTFALREGLYGLASIEKILLANAPEQQSYYFEVLEREMLENPVHWKSYFSGTETEKHVSRAFGLSDRSRYYMSVDSVKAAEKKLIDNLSCREIPVGLIHQFFPLQYKKISKGLLDATPAELLKDKICNVLDDYKPLDKEE